MPAALVFLEVFLKIMCGIPFSFPEFAGTVLFALGIGFAVDLLCLIFNSETVNAWCLFGITELFTVFFLLMYFLNDAYKVFMDPVSVAVGTEGVVKNFSETILSTVITGIPVILLFHVPAFAVLTLAILKKIHLSHKGKTAPITAAVLALVMLAGSFLSLTSREHDIERLTSSYSYDSSIRSFGLLPSTALETWYGIFGNSYENFSFEDIPSDGTDEEGNSTDINEPADPSGDIHDTGDAEEDTPVIPDENENTDQETRPEQDTEPEPEPEPEPVIYTPNSLQIDFDALCAETGDQTLLSLYRYVSSLTPSMKNEYTGLFEGKNLILITAEAFSKEVIDEKRTPALYRMATKGIVFDDYYQPAWGGSTSTGEFSVLTGIFPVNKVASVSQTKGHNLYFTMGNQLMRKGYKSVAYHNGSYTYYSRNLTHKYFGYTDFIGMGNGMELGVESRWPESDLEMFKYIMPQYLDGSDPFSLYFMTVSGHCVYTRTGNSMTSKNWKYVSDMDCSDTVKGYHAANYEFELAMEYLIDALEKSGQADNTVIVISADHYPYGLEKSTAWGNTEDYLSELYGYPANSNTSRDHNALIIWSGCLEDREEPITVTSPVYSLDIVPTLSNLFGLPYDSRMFVGRDVLSDEDPLVIWADSSFKTELGYYHAPSGVFYPGEGTSVENTADYVSQIKAVVKNKIAFSRGLLNYDFYDYIQAHITTEEGNPS